MTTCIEDTRDHCVYRVDGHNHWLILDKIKPSRGRPRSAIPVTPRLLRRIADTLGHANLLFRNDTTPVFRTWRGTYTHAYGTQQVLAGIDQYITFGEQYSDSPLTFAPSALDSEVTDTDRYVERLVGSAKSAAGEYLIRTLDLSTRDGFSALCWGENGVKEFGSNLPWPIAGELRECDDIVYLHRPAPPECGRDYPHLKRLFSSHDYDALSHQSLHMYLLGCFSTAYIEHAVPLLAIDSWEQGMAKSETGLAVTTILHGSRENGMAAPRGDKTDTLVAFFGNDKYVAVLDNLDNVQDYNHTWLAGLLSDRGGNERGKYARNATNFRARGAITTGIYGRFSLHEDMLSRAWRVQIQGTKDKWGQGGPEIIAKDYALEHRDALVSECYWAVKRSAEAVTTVDVTSMGRCYQFAEAGARAYQEVFGTLDLTGARAEVDMLSTRALAHLKRERAPFRVPTILFRTNPDASYKPAGTALGKDWS